jgi:DNA-binding transcriptional LysR family regulator
MDRLVEMSAFVAVADAQSFSAAARKLGLSAPTITRSVAALEARLGARLLVRSTRRVRLTDAGLQFLEDARRLLADIEDAEQAVAGAQVMPRGTLRLSAPVLFGEMYVQPLLREFLSAHPQLNAHLLLLDRVINLVEEGFDLALRIGNLDDHHGLQAVPLGQVRRMLVASPAYIASHGVPGTPADLRNHRITLSIGSNASPDWTFGRGEGALTERMQATLTVNTLRAAIDSARVGWALTRVLSYQVQDDLAAGRLLPLLEEFEPAPLPVHLVFPLSRRPSAKLMAFVELARDRLEAQLRPERLLRQA